MRTLIASLVMGLFAASAARAEPTLVWPQFRGPGGSGIAEGQKPPIELGPDKNVKWKSEVASGSSSPIVVGDLLVLTAFDGGKLYTIAYTRRDGKEAWRAHAPAKAIEPYHITEGSPAASTPVTDGKRIVSYFGSCGLFCYDLTGKELWRYELPTAATPFDFGTGVSPILVDGRVVLVRDENKSPKILAIDAATGNLAWEKQRESKSAFCTPVACDTPQGKEIVVAGWGKMIGYDLKTGEENWCLIGMPSCACASPVVVDSTLYFAGWSPGDDVKPPTFDALLKDAEEEQQGYITPPGLQRVFFKGMLDGQDFDHRTARGEQDLPGRLKGMFTSHDWDHDDKLTREEWDDAVKLLGTSKNSAFALKLGGSGDVSESHVLWKQKSGLPYVPSGLVYRGQYVLVKDGGVVTIYDAKSGKQTFQKRAAASGRYYASPVAANGFIYFTSLDDGVITVMKSTGEKPEVVTKNPSLEERVMATPVIADDTLYVRTAGNLYAFRETP
ncbi:MAG TPA: PQQ-binding-like beta-propeller repeat protein [Pirellulales bacterium]|jgi:outer membrane protein assembly factor BamB|nr:PQQ-binding-like beta-propeller repeat protein [Pirellulales bacterium]